MAKTINYHFPLDHRIHPNVFDAWPWVAAIDASDFGDKSLLNGLLAKSHPPPELENIVSDILTGRRMPNKKAAAKLKIPAKDRMHVASAISFPLGLISDLKTGGWTAPLFGGEKIIERNADRQRTEPINVVRDLEKEAQMWANECADELGVSVETVENLLRDLRRKIKDYPDI